MNTDKLVELYLKRAPSGMTQGEVTIEIAFLSRSMTEEQIFFSINYLSLHYPDDIQEDLAGAVLLHKNEIMKYYQLAKVKQDIKQAEKGAAEYDPSNNKQRADKPEWIRKGIDFNLFK